MKEILTYITLVGIPILGLVGIVRLGHTLDAPPAVYGVWVADSAAAPEACSEPALRLFRAGLTVQQSGRHLSASPARDREESLTGTLVGDSVRLSGVLSDMGATTGATCEAGTRLALTLRLVAADSSRRLSGEASFPDCARCAPMPVTFTIAPAAAPTARGASPAVHR